MSNKLICPLCQQELRKIHPTYVICDNCRITGEDKLWQELIRTKELLEIEDAEHSMCHTQMLKTTEKLERTRKALDIAVGALKEQQRWFGVIRVSLISHLNNQYGTLFKSYDADPTVVNVKRANDILNRALDQITALEQKDVK